MAVSIYKDLASGSTITGVTSSSGNSKSGAYTNNGGAGVRATTPYSNGSYTKPNSTPVSYKEGQAYVRNPTLTTPSSRGNTPPSSRPVTPTRTVTETVSSGSSGGYTPSNGGDDIIGRIKSLLEEQKKAADEYYKTMYEKQLSEINQQAENNRNNANLNYMRGDRYIRSLYGSNISGQVLSNRARNNSMWQNNLSSIRQNQANNQATAKSNYNTNLANTASQLAQGWYNYVLPYYSNEANQLRNIELQKYAMSL